MKIPVRIVTPYALHEWPPLSWFPCHLYSQPSSCFPRSPASFCLQTFTLGVLLSTMFYPRLDSCIAETPPPQFNCLLLGHMPSDDSHDFLLLFLGCLLCFCLILHPHDGSHHTIHSRFHFIHLSVFSCFSESSLRASVFISASWDLITSV